jgi:hypothetical protein
LGVAILGGRAGFAQAPAPPARDINPPVTDCNMTQDTRANPPPRVATPIDKSLLTSGQPCQQVVNTIGLVTDDPLANLQRGFDFYSWLTFIALNSPADGKVIGQGPRPGGDAKTKWENLQNYRPLADVMQHAGAKPEWGTRVVPNECKPLDGPSHDKMIVHLAEEAFNQPFKTGPLIDQAGNYAIFDILMNRPMFDYILVNGLYSKQGQERFEQTIEFPSGVNPVNSVQPGGAAQPGRMGAIMLKVSWRILDRQEDKDLIPKFHTVDALVFFPGPPFTKTGPTCVAKTLGLVGFHVGHKTVSAPQWVWTSFEHAKNVPDKADVDAGKLDPPYNFYNPACKDCVTNDTPPMPWDPDATLKFRSNYRSQVVRTPMLPGSSPEAPGPLVDEVKQLNDAFHAILKDTVWENYVLLATQWPSDRKCTQEKDPTKVIDPTCSPAPTYLANSTLETYSQGRVPLASSSCMACHGNATNQHVPATASDFTFILEKAQCLGGKCGSAPTNGSIRR